MGSPSPEDSSSQKAIEGDLLETGQKLLSIPSSTDDLLTLLEKAQSLLAKVWQRPPVSTCFALLPAMKALITDDILCHNDVNVHVAVASCFNELTRITCPDPPYDDDIMMVIFRLFMIAFMQLSCESGQNYSKALLIIETMAKVRSFLMLLDIDTDGHIIVEMFQVFLSSIKLNDSCDLFKYMEMIMTSVIEESDEISSELLRPLLASAKMDNKSISPASWKLAKNVFENCANKLPSYLRAAVQEMDLVLADYAVIVTSICHFIGHDTSNGKSMVSNKVSPKDGERAFQLDLLSEAVHESRDPTTNDGNRTKLNDDNSLEMLKVRQSGTDSGALRSRRGRKPNSVMRPEEGYQHVWMTGSKYSDEVSFDGYNEEKDALSLVSKKENESNVLDTSKKKKKYYFEEGSLGEKGQPKRYDDLKFPQTLKNGPMKTGKRVIGESSSVNVKKGKGILGDTHIGGEYDLLPDRNKQKDDVLNKVDSKKMKSKRSRVSYGKELVNLRIQVWWPMDETFYTGTVTAFDPETKKHTILYDDEEIEILNLRKETWGLYRNEQPPQPVKILKKTTSRRAVSSKLLHAASSPKRLKIESGSAIIKYELDDETRETSVMPKDGVDHGGEPVTLLENMKIQEDVAKD
ncbi:hypothetical protein OROMI_004242 [Orobanche minor]